MAWSIKQIVDHAVDIGSKRIMLSPNHHKSFCRVTGMRPDGSALHYRGARILKWKRNKLK